MLHKAKIWSIQPLPLLNLACSSLSVVSIALSSILQNILPGTGSRVIPLQLSQLPRSRFFGSLNIRTPLLQSLGTTSCSQILMKVCK